MKPEKPNDIMTHFLALLWSLGKLYEAIVDELSNRFDLNSGYPLSDQLPTKVRVRKAGTVSRSHRAAAKAAAKTITKTKPSARKSPTARKAKGSKPRKSRPARRSTPPGRTPLVSVTNPNVSALARLKGAQLRSMAKTLGVIPQAAVGAQAKRFLIWRIQTVPAKRFESLHLVTLQMMVEQLGLTVKGRSNTTNCIAVLMQAI